MPLSIRRRSRKTLKQKSSKRASTRRKPTFRSSSSFDAAQQLTQDVRDTPIQTMTDAQVSVGRLIDASMALMNLLWAEKEAREAELAKVLPLGVVDPTFSVKRKEGQRLIEAVDFAKVQYLRAKKVYNEALLLKKTQDVAEILVDMGEGRRKRVRTE